jgi:uncharacterized protein (DUF433 family)
MNWQEHISVDPAVCHGQVCVRGTRVPVSVVLDHLAARVSRDEILQSYPSITDEDIDACLAYASELSIQNVGELQLEAYRRMTGEQRLRIGLGLYEASLEIAREGLRGRFPNASESEVQEKLRARVRAGYEIELFKSNSA